LLDLSASALAFFAEYHRPDIPQPGVVPGSGRLHGVLEPRVPAEKLSKASLEMIGRMVRQARPSVNSAMSSAEKRRE
jgi:hypothetical protein